MFGLLFLATEEFTHEIDRSLCYHRLCINHGLGGRLFFDKDETNRRFRASVNKAFRVSQAAARGRKGRAASAQATAYASGLHSESERSLIDEHLSGHALAEAWF